MKASVEVKDTSGVTALENARQNDANALKPLSSATLNVTIGELVQIKTNVISKLFYTFQ